jgi:hypothetical protein
MHTTAFMQLQGNCNCVNESLAHVIQLRRQSERLSVRLSLKCTCPGHLPHGLGNLPPGLGNLPPALGNLSSACFHLTMRIVDHTHQLCIGFEGKYRIWTSCGYASKVRWVGGRRPSLGDLPRPSSTWPRQPATWPRQPLPSLLPPDHAYCRPHPSAVLWI